MLLDRNTYKQSGVISLVGNAIVFRSTSHKNRDGSAMHNGNLHFLPYSKSVTYNKLSRRIIRHIPIAVFCCIYYYETVFELVMGYYFRHFGVRPRKAEFGTGIVFLEILVVGNGRCEIDSFRTK